MKENKKGKGYAVAKSAPLLKVLFLFYFFAISGLMENPFVGKKLKSEHPSKMHQRLDRQVEFG